MPVTPVCALRPSARGRGSRVPSRSRAGIGIARAPMARRWERNRAPRPVARPVQAAHRRV
ncbi:MAG: hypothetical protein E2P01_04285 [Acidobacteria bacterium]|nr:MAG: hypothetical protein E2P01_04285 [Acidobacteriota bacterium]